MNEGVEVVVIIRRFIVVVAKCVVFTLRLEGVRAIPLLLVA